MVLEAWEAHGPQICVLAEAMAPSVSFWGLGFRASGLGFGVSAFGFRILGLKIEKDPMDASKPLKDVLKGQAYLVSAFACRVSGLGFRVWYRVIIGFRV